jgi:hypothetical protein
MPTSNLEKWSASGSLISSLATGGGSDLRNDLVLQGGHQLRSPRNVAIGYTQRYLTKSKPRSYSFESSMHSTSFAHDDPSEADRAIQVAIGLTKAIGVRPSAQ